MPSTYAHYRLGQQVRQALSGPQREAVEAWPALYLIGLHGPDILFYYHPLSSHPVKAVGHLLHGRFRALALPDHLAGMAEEPPPWPAM